MRSAKRTMTRAGRKTRTGGGECRPGAVPGFWPVGVQAVVVQDGLAVKFLHPVGEMAGSVGELAGVQERDA